MIPNCHQTHRLVIESYDRSLPFLTRVGIRIHLFACDACTHFSRQMKLLRFAMRRL
jgi:nitrate/TMAO reductase-like tetraheme cytochrome c subunit